MKTLKLIALAAFALLFSQCKSPTQAVQTQSSASLTEVARTLDTTQSQLLLYADSTNGNPRAALELAAQWLKSQSNIQSVFVLDSNYLYFA